MEERDSNELSNSESGKVFNDGHQQPEGQKGNTGTKLIIRVMVAVGVLIILVGMFLNMGTPLNDPPGEAPEGKVWSPEHDHWHDAK